LPTTTVPNDKLVGLAASEPGAIPVPDRDIASVGFAPFDVIVTDPVTLPVVCGANATVNVVL